jgi:hypothetical protein
VKRKALAFILIIVIALSIATWFVYNRISELQGQNSELQEPVESVKITDFEWTSDWGPGSVGFQWGRSFNITLQNLGDSAVEGLSVDIKLLANGAKLWSSTGLYGPGIIGYTAEYNGFDGKLNASEPREIRGDIITRLDVLDEARDLGEKTLSVRVMMNVTILDELPLPYA